MLYQYDLTLLQWANSWIFWRPWADTLTVFSAEWLGWWVVAGLLVFGALAFLPRFSQFRRRNWEMVLVALVAGLVARFGITELIRVFYDRPRPFEVLADLKQLVFHDGGGAFPSGHATFFFALAAVVSRYYPKTSIIFFLAVLNLSVARVQSGLHWPSDILGGAVIGVVIGYIIPALWQRLYVRHRDSDS